MTLGTDRDFLEYKQYELQENKKENKNKFKNIIKIKTFTL